MAVAEVAQIIGDGGAAVAVIVAIVLFLRALQNQRESFRQMIVDQNDALKEHSAKAADCQAKLVVVIERNTEMLGRVSAQWQTPAPHDSGLFRNG